MYCMYAAASKVLQQNKGGSGTSGRREEEGGNSDQVYDISTKTNKSNKNKDIFLSSKSKSNNNSTSLFLNAHMLDCSYDQNIHIFFDFLNDPQRHFIDRFSCVHSGK